MKFLIWFHCSYCIILGNFLLAHLLTLRSFRLGSMAFGRRESNKKVLFPGPWWKSSRSWRTEPLNLILTKSVTTLGSFFRLSNRLKDTGNYTRNWAWSYKEFLSVNLPYADFKHYDWLKKLNTQSECLKLSVA